MSKIIKKLFEFNKIAKKKKKLYSININMKISIMTFHLSI